MKINEKNMCTFATTPPFDLDGWLNKRGEVNKAWQKRWFVLKGNLLFYFERKTDKEPIGAIILEGCTVELAEEGEQYCFQIVFHGVNNRTYYLSAESQEAMELWMKALTCAGYEYIKLMVTELQRQLYEIEGNNSRADTPVEQPPKAPPRRQNPFNRPAPPRPIYSPNTTMVQSPSLPNSRIVNRDIPPMNPSTTSFAIGSSTFHTGVQQAGTTVTPLNTGQVGGTGGNHHHLHHNNHTNHLTSPGSGNDRDDDNLFAVIHELLGRQIMREFNERKNLKTRDIKIDEPLIQL